MKVIRISDEDVKLLHGICDDVVYDLDELIDRAYGDIPDDEAMALISKRSAIQRLDSRIGNALTVDSFSETGTGKVFIEASPHL